MRSLTPQLTQDADYFDAAGGAVPQNQREQSWYPAPRMVYGSPSAAGAREAARGMTLERTVVVDELGGNTVEFRNYAVAYYDARGARTYARVWDTATPGRDTADVSQMRMTAGSFVFKLLFSAARPSDFPEDVLAGSLALDILPNANGPAVNVRLLQIDIAVKDARAGATGWYFATYAYDRTATGSTWRRMIPLGLTWGNDPSGPPLRESWMNPAAPAYARGSPRRGGKAERPGRQPRLGVHELPQHGPGAEPRQHGAARVGAVRSLAAELVPRPAGQPAVRPVRPPRVRVRDRRGRRDPQRRRLLAAARLHRRAVAAAPSAATFNPCTWDDATPPPPASRRPRRERCGRSRSPAIRRRSSVAATGARRLDAAAPGG